MSVSLRATSILILLTVACALSSITNMKPTTIAAGNNTTTTTTTSPSKNISMNSKGIILPQCESKEDALKVVEAVKFPPLGKRGLARDRWNSWGMGTVPKSAESESDSSIDTFERRVEIANQNSVVGVMIENSAGVEALDDILQVSTVTSQYAACSNLPGCC